MPHIAASVVLGLQRAILCESAIDCLSYQTLHPPEEKTIYLSTDGAGYVPVEQLQHFSQVTLALDNDAAGQQIAEKLKRDLPQVQIQTPEAKDWNQDLQTEMQRMQAVLDQKHQEKQAINPCQLRGYSL